MPCVPVTGGWYPHRPHASVTATRKASAEAASGRATWATRGCGAARRTECGLPPAPEVTAAAKDEKSQQNQNHYHRGAHVLLSFGGAPSSHRIDARILPGSINRAKWSGILPRTGGTTPVRHARTSSPVSAPSVRPGGHDAPSQRGGGAENRLAPRARAGSSPGGRLVARNLRDPDREPRARDAARPAHGMHR
jgi:hypothetical protein